VFVKDRGPFLVGPLARLNLNAEKLLPRAAELLPKVCQTIGKTLPWRNNYLSLLARSLECVHALELAADVLGNYAPPVRARVPIVPRAGVGCHGTEAPRGICWHEYRTEADGTIASARIIAPTTQNYATIEDDLRELAPQLASLPDEDLTLRCEHVIRNYDPCISCSVHFLKVHRR
jgi:sulfhydrogenase subunit alpha